MTERHVLEHLAHERVPVGVEAARRKAKKDIARPDGRPDADRDLFAVRRRDQRLDALQRTLICLDVDAGRGVRQSLAGHQTLISWIGGVSNCILSTPPMLRMGTPAGITFAT